MSPHQIIAVAVRLFAVWLAVTTVVSAPTFYMQLIEVEVSSTASLAAAVFVAALALGIVYVLWRFPLTIAGKLLTTASQEPVESASPDLWLAMGCSIVGLWLITSHLPTLVTMLVFGGIGEWSVSVWLPNLTGLALGLWLVFGARGFRKLFWWTRHAGHRQPAGDDSS
jgi:hypothetical protein